MSRTVFRIAGTPVLVAVALLLFAASSPAQESDTAREPAATPATSGGAPLDAVPADGPTACVNEESHRFDFWPGTWEIESRRMDGSGEWHETRNRWVAETVLGGCAFVDYGNGDFGSGPIRGMGTRYYDPDEDVWYITWMSTENPGVLEIWEGGFDEDGVGDFYQEVETPTDTLLSRIRWWDVTEDSAEWEHAISRDGGETWQPTWRMSLSRAEGE